jgi:hypothetical protein
MAADLRDDFREFFLLEKARKRSAGLTITQQRTIRTFYRGARRRIAVARGLREPDQSHAGLSLYRGAALLLTFAYLASKDENIDLDPLSPDAAFQKLVEMLKTDRRDPPPPSLALARRWVAGPDPLAVERLSAQEAGCAIDDFEVTTRWLLRLVEPRSPRHLAMTRGSRLLAPALCAVALFVWAGSRLFSPKDIARHKPARSSSADYHTDPAGAVDGEKDGTFGFHSHLEDNPWWSVDLQRPYRINSIKVFGRGDCCYDQSVPIALEVSDDGKSFRKIAERTEAFSEKDPWVVRPASTFARLVRVRAEHNGYLVLSEVEIYGK